MNIPDLVQPLAFMGRTEDLEISHVEDGNFEFGRPGICVRVSGQVLDKPEIARVQLFLDEEAITHLQLWLAKRHWELQRERFKP